MSILRQHGRFVLVVVICLAVGLVAHGRIKPISEDADRSDKAAEDAVRGLMRTAIADVKRAGVTANVEIGNRRAWQGLTETLVTRQATELSYQELEDFRIPAELAGDDAQRENQYAEILRRVQTRLGYARYWGPKRITGDGAGKTEVEYDFAAVSGVDAKPIPARLIRLDLLTRTAVAASSANVSSTLRVQEFRFREPEIDKLKARIPSVEVGKEPGPRGEVPGRRPMLGRIEAVVTVRGLPVEIHRLLALLQNTEVDGVSGRALYFENFRIAKDDWRDSGDDLVTLSGTLVATRVAAQAPLPVASIERALARIPKDSEPAATGDGTGAAGTAPGEDDSDGAFSSGTKPADTGRRRPGGGR
jgi:hypothetical protein